MKKIICLLFFTNLFFAQNEPQLQWAKSQTNSRVGGAFSVESSALDSLGNLYLVGNFINTADFDPSANAAELTSAGLDMFIAKYDANGNFIWAKNIGGSGTITPKSIVINNNAIYITGSFKGTIDFDASAATVNLTSNGDTDIFITQYDTDSNFVATKTIGSTTSDDAFDIKFYNDEIIIAGFFTGTVDFDPSANTAESTSSNNSKDIFIAKYNAATLGYITAFQIGGTASDLASAIAIDTTGNINVIGIFRGTVDFDPSAAISNMVSVSATISDTFIAKYSNSGSFIWAKNIGARNTSDAYVNKITLDSTNAVLVTGCFTTTSDFDPSAATVTLTNTTNGQDIFIAKYSSIGNYVWAKKYGITTTTQSDIGRCIRVDQADSVYLCGLIYSTISFGSYSVNSNNGSGFIAKYSPAGVVEYAFNTGSKATSIAINGTSVYVTGNYLGNLDFNPSTTDTNILYAEIDNGFIAKYDVYGNYLFSKDLGGIGSDNTVNLVSSDANGFIYRAGNLSGTADLDPSGATVNVNSSGWTDFFIAKYTSDGSYLWSKVIDGLKSNGITGMKADPSGNVYVLGRYNGTVDFDPSPATFYLPENSTSYPTASPVDLYLAKYDTNGNFLWAKRIAAVTLVDSMEFDSSGNVYFLGKYNGTVDFDPSAATYNQTSLASGLGDMYFIKFNSDGDFIWVKSLRCSFASLPYKIYVKNNSIYLGGIFGGTVDFDPSPTQTNSLAFDGPLAGFLAKYDLDGNYVFAHGFSDPDTFNSVWIMNVMEDSSQNIYFLAYYAGTVDFDPSPTGTSTLTLPRNGYALVKYSPTGSFLWGKNILDPTNTTNSFVSVISASMDNNNVISVCGPFSGAFDFDPSSNEALLTSSADTAPDTYKKNVFIAKYNPDGNLISAKRIEGDYDSPNAYAYLDNQMLLVSGTYNGSADFDLSGNSNLMTSSSTRFHDRFFAKYYNLPLGLEEYGNQNLFSIYPNPASGILNIHSPVFDSYTIRISDLTGKTLYSGIGKSTFDVSDYATGLYMITIENKENNKIETHKFLKN